MVTKRILKLRETKKTLTIRVLNSQASLEIPSKTSSTMELSDKNSSLDLDLRVFSDQVPLVAPSPDSESELKLSPLLALTPSLVTLRPPLLPTPPPPAIQQRRHYHTQPPLNRRILDTQTQSSDNCLSNQNFESTRTLVKRRKKSIPGHTSRDGVSSESILHAIVQSELFSLQNEEAI